ncbi:hypothetical protein AUR04nite_08420 [Glutamicibacter uratoxydans]|uniref:DUF4365 domain-containing protein n=1 Tax=Glutamicibacter uratoxydans TaxID=43667 RepID=A0A4Y4DNY0_GLUUR|nr:DUF4365 domain-containing protein [Glutamicibacter uratoxydans]GED05310.1 hypothetical protein AUR04nite_08420 [Glutamicibacter uratoxydans]
MHIPRTKQRHINHINGDKGIDIVMRSLPEHWVTRVITPDYGLDLHVEVFESDLRDPRSANTLGEHFYIQVKSSENIEQTQITVRSRLNVTKYDPDPNLGDTLEINVVKINLETSELLTVETMGAAVPVVLCYVDLSTEDTYYVCLNDYLSKSLLPYKHSYELQGSVTLYLPSWNVLDKDDPSFSYFRLLARRSKFYAAFNTFSYQFRELQIAFPSFIETHDEQSSDMVLPASSFLTMARTFLRSALRLAIWEPVGDAFWSPLSDVQKELSQLEKDLPQHNQTVAKANLNAYMEALYRGFYRAANLGRMYEELVREWRQPTFLSTNLDYNKIHKHNPPEWP